MANRPARGKATNDEDTARRRKLKIEISVRLPDQFQRADQRRRRPQLVEGQQPQRIAANRSKCERSRGLFGFRIVTTSPGLFLSRPTRLVA
jgi:hypothetical protein